METDEYHGRRVAHRIGDVEVAVLISGNGCVEAVVLKY